MLFSDTKNSYNLLLSSTQGHFWLIHFLTPFQQTVLQKASANEQIPSSPLNISSSPSSKTSSPAVSEDEEDRCTGEMDNDIAEMTVIEQPSEMVTANRYVSSAR
jgi:hypothetical protein